MLGGLDLDFSQFQTTLHIGEQATVGFRLHETHVAAERRHNIDRAVVVAGQLVETLRVVDRQTVDLIFTGADELVADLLHHRHNDTVEEMMALDVEIGGLGRDTQSAQVARQFTELLLRPRIALAQGSELAVDLALQVVKQDRSLARRKGAESHDIVEVGDGEEVVLPPPIEEDVPQKEGVDDLTIATQEGIEVEDLAVVEGHRDTHIVEARSIALVVFYRIDVGVEDVRIVADLFRVLRPPLEEVVVVGIDAGQHVLARAVEQQARQHRLLAAREFFARG